MLRVGHIVYLQRELDIYKKVRLTFNQLDKYLAIRITQAYLRYW